MKISYSDYIKRSDVSVLVAEAIFKVLGNVHPLKKIEEVATTTSGGTPARGISEFYDGDIPWLKSGELNDSFIYTSEEFITDKGLSSSSAKLHPAGTLLIALYGATVGKTGITMIRASTNQAVCAVFPGVEVERDYLFWFFRAHRYKFIEISKGGAQPNISQAVILKTKVPVPPLAIQKEIVAVLQRVSEAKDMDAKLIPSEYRETVVKVFASKNNVGLIERELTNQQNLVKQLREAFLREAIQGRLVKQYIKEGYGKDLLKQAKAEKAKSGKKEKELIPIKPDEIPFEIPVNWVWCRLIDVFNSATGGTPDRGNTEYWGGDISWLKSGELNDDYLHQDSEEKITTKGFENSSTRIFPEGTLLIALYGATAGKLGILKIKSATNQAICGFYKSSFVNTKYLFYYLMNWRKKFVEDSWGQAQPNISQTYLRNFLFALPPLSEQNRIVEKVEQLMEICDKLQQSIEQSKQQNEMLLQQVLREALQPKENEVEI